MKKKITLDIEIPLVPNYIRDIHARSIHISEFSEEELRDIGSEWIEELVKKARNKKNYAN